MALTIAPENFAVGFGVGLPALLYVYLFWTRKPRLIRSAPPPKIGPEPDLPQQIRPALAGLFLDGRITEAEIAGTIVDLFVRGYLGVLDKGEVIVLIKQRRLDDLPSFEKTIADHILVKGSIVKNELEIERRINRKIYDEHISDAIRSLYKEGLAHGFFARDPIAQYAWYYFAGLMIFFAGIVSFGLLVRFFSETPTLLFYSLGLLLTGSTIITQAKHMSALGRGGQLMQEIWHDYREELRQFRPFDKHDVYLQYLPYAFALGIEDAWTARWKNVVFQRPEWFTTFEVPTREEFLAKFGRVIKVLARDLYALRDPAI